VGTPGNVAPRPEALFRSSFGGWTARAACSSPGSVCAAPSWRRARARWRPASRKRGVEKGGAAGPGPAVRLQVEERRPLLQHAHRGHDGPLARTADPAGRATPGLARNKNRPPWTPAPAAPPEGGS